MPQAPHKGRQSLDKGVQTEWKVTRGTGACMQGIRLLRGGYWRLRAVLSMEARARRPLPGSELQAIGKRHQGSHLILRLQVSRCLTWQARNKEAPKPSFVLCWRASFELPRGSQP